jgi:hypothetical protein
LPAVVVLPVPLTPTMMMTLGFFASGFSASSVRSMSRPHQREQLGAQRVAQLSRITLTGHARVGA